MKISRTYFISEPKEKGELYEFTIDNCDIPFYCDSYSAKTRKLANKILDTTQDEYLLSLIYQYGEARGEEIRESQYN